LPGCSETFIGYFCSKLKKPFAALKTHKTHIFHSWLLLICFIAGQYLVHTHQHISVKKSSISQIAKTTAHQNVTEKCWLCDVMHYNFMTAAIGSVIIATPASRHIFENFNYSFTTVQPILLAGRAPPAGIFSV